MFICIQRAQSLQAARLSQMPPPINKSERLTHPPGGRGTARVILLLEQRHQPRQLGPQRYQYLWLFVHVGKVTDRSEDAKHLKGRARRARSPATTFWTSNARSLNPPWTRFIRVSASSAI